MQLSLQKIKQNQERIKQQGVVPSPVIIVDELVKKVEELNNSLRDASALKDKIETEFDSNVSNFQDEYKQICSDIDALIADVKDTISNVQKGDAGVDGSDYVLTEQDKKDIAKTIKVPIVEKVIEKIEVIKEQPIVTEITKVTNEVKEVAITDKPDVIVDKINDSKKLIDKSKIKGLEQELRSIASKASGVGTGVRGGQGSWSQINLIGTIDGNNTVFTFSGLPSAQYSERIYLNYIAQNPMTDYTINYKTNTVTYTVAPDISLSGLPHIIRYMNG